MKVFIFFGMTTEIRYYHRMTTRYIRFYIWGYILPVVLPVYQPSINTIHFNKTKMFSCTRILLYTYNTSGLPQIQVQISICTVMSENKFRIKKPKSSSENSEFFTWKLAIFYLFVFWLNSAKLVVKKRK